MKKSFISLILSVSLITSLLVSCEKIKEYFKDPETESLTDVIKTSAVIGFSASAAMSVMEGYDLPYVRLKTRCSNFPCVSIMVIKIGNNSPFPFWSDKTGEIVVAGLWADNNTAILTMLMTDFEVHTKTFKLKNIYTIPVIRTFDGKLMAVFASMDINFNPETNNLLEFNLQTGEINSEYARIPANVTDDLYVAVGEDAYVIEIDQNNTLDNLYDDSYSVTGGGQLAKIDGNATEVIQQAMVAVRLNHSCRENPVNGYGLIRKINIKDEKFPELGTAILKFNPTCDGTAEVTLATGMYIGSNGQDVSLDLN